MVKYDIKFEDTQNNKIEFRNILINVNGHLSFHLYVNDIHKSYRYILKTQIDVNSIITMLKLNLPFNYNQFFAMSQKYCKT